MYKKSTVIVNATGLHARPAGDFIACAKRFSSDITVRRLGDDRKECNGKKIMALLTLGLKKGTDVEIEAAGSDEKEAVETLTAMIDGGFGEK